MNRKSSDILGNIIFSSRWALYPINAGLLLALLIYVVRFLHNDYIFIRYNSNLSLEAVMVAILGLVDSFMVANLLMMIIQGSHQIFIKRFEIKEHTERPQWLDHVDSGILKVKVALSIAGITLIQILKDFVNIEQVDWIQIVHRMWIHGVCLLSALLMAIIWRLTHPQDQHQKSEAH
jgi:uncharacterized protein (TIGR00645 family)